MQKNLKTYVIRNVILIVSFLALIFLFRFPIDLFGLDLLSMNVATRLFSKSDALKIVALAILFFSLYYKDRIAKIKHTKIRPWLTAGFIGGGVLAATGYYALRYFANVYEITAGLWLYVFMFASLILLLIAFVSFVVGIFTWSYVKRFYIVFRKELWVTAGLSAAGYYLLMLFQNQWPFFSRNIAKLLYVMLVPFFPVYMELARAPILDVNNFVVSIGAPCSGIESLFLFAAFSIGIFLLDHKRLNPKTYWLVALIGLVGIYFLNVLRLFLLILAGIYIDPDFAVGLFHTNVGWILFVVYFFCYYYIITTFIYKSNSPKKK